LGVGRKRYKNHPKLSKKEKKVNAEEQE